MGAEGTVGGSKGGLFWLAKLLSHLLPVCSLPRSVREASMCGLEELSLLIASRDPELITAEM